MDFLRPRAIPALIALAVLAPAIALGADCSALDGTYRYESAAVPGAQARHLSELTPGPERRKLVVTEAHSAPRSLNPKETLQRPKVTYLAASVIVKQGGNGASFRFMDAAGKELAEMRIDSPGRWSCNGARLERVSERMAGLGDAIRTEKLEEVLERNAAGDLVYRETVTVVDPPGVKPVRTEARFPAKP